MNNSLLIWLREHCDDIRGDVAAELIESLQSQLADMTKQRDELLVACKGAANYIDRLGGNSGAYRSAIANVKGEV